MLTVSAFTNDLSARNGPALVSRCRCGSRLTRGLPALVHELFECLPSLEDEYGAHILHARADADTGLRDVHIRPVLMRHCLDVDRNTAAPGATRKEHHRARLAEDRIAGRLGDLGLDLRFGLEQLGERVRRHLVDGGALLGRGLCGLAGLGHLFAGLVAEGLRVHVGS